MYGALYNILRPKYQSPLREALLQHTNLVDYTNFITEKYFSDKSLK